jgi:hypothetical protein
VRSDGVKFTPTQPFPTTAAARISLLSCTETMMTPAKMRVLGWLVLAHGVLHATLVFQQGLTPLLWTDAIPAALYATSMIGLLIAGLGLVGVRCVDAAVGPLLVLASGLSLVAIAKFGEPVSWLGGVCVAVLLVIGVWRGYTGWPAHLSQEA